MANLEGDEEEFADINTFDEINYNPCVILRLEIMRGNVLFIDPLIDLLDKILEKIQNHCPVGFKFANTLPDILIGMNEISSETNVYLEYIYKVAEPNYHKYPRGMKAALGRKLELVTDFTKKLSEFLSKVLNRLGAKSFNKTDLVNSLKKRIPFIMEKGMCDDY